MVNRFKLLLGQIVNLPYRRNSLFALVIVSIGVIVAEILFDSIYPGLMSWINSSFNIKLDPNDVLNLDFVPELWAGVLAMILSTLIIVIAIAAENTPKLIDLYLKDWVSLFYIWFLIISSLHALLVMFYATPMARPSSAILNVYGFLFLASVCALPYVFYILMYSKTDRVVRNIYRLNQRHVRWIRTRLIRFAMENQSVVESYQATLMSTIDQFDDLMQYTPFKEPKSEIISQVGETLRFYISSKDVINPKFFQVTPTVRRNLTFRTYVEAQYEELGERQAFYEVKAFRMLGNAYTNLMEGDDYELASLITSEVVEIGRLALELNQEQLVREVIIRFNTFFRFSIKHAIRNNDPRNLYNLSFYYGNLLIAFADYDRAELVKEGYFYFRFYRSEISKNTTTNPALHFIGDALTAELRRVSIFVSDKGWREADQEALLNEILLLDNPRNLEARELEPSTQRGVRMLQIGLALHYLKRGQQRLAEIVIEDVLGDLELYGETVFSTTLDGILNQLRYSQPAFWEDTDRGNTNIHYSPDTDYIDSFKALLDEHLQARVKS